MTTSRSEIVRLSTTAACHANYSKSYGAYLQNVQVNARQSCHEKTKHWSKMFNQIMKTLEQKHQANKAQENWRCAPRCMSRKNKNWSKSVVIRSQNIRNPLHRQLAEKQRQSLRWYVTKKYYICYYVSRNDEMKQIDTSYKHVTIQSLQKKYRVVIIRNK